MPHEMNVHSQSGSKQMGECRPPDVSPADACCELICFERPNYFCGHMLTDRDLMTDQRYVREKNKLYHRALDGHGIVCGLRITCHHDCPGQILIEEGYAIDNCGNDLIVCKTTSFDVITRLRDKRLVYDEPEQNPCESKEQQPTCEVTQCFHVTLCYRETKEAYTTPFVAGCAPGLTECEPTRIREGVYFDVIEELPVEESWIDQLERRIRKCFELFTNSSFAKKLQQEKAKLRQLVADSQTSEAPENCWQLFCELRNLLWQYLKRYPDRYNCAIEEELFRISFPSKDGNSENGDFTSCHDAICQILNLGWQYVMACVLGEFLPQCQEPASARCIVLGTVEVKSGKVVKVCNCPRTYLQPMDRVKEVMIASVIGQLACKTDRTDDVHNQNYEGQPNPCKRPHQTHVCCATYSFDCKYFVEQIVESPIDQFLPLQAVLQYLSELRQSGKRFSEMYDFTNTRSVSPDYFRRPQNAEEADVRAFGSNVNKTHIRVAAEQDWYVSNLRSQSINGLLNRADPVQILTDGIEGPVIAAYTPRGTEALLKAEIDTLRFQLNKLETQFQTMSETKTSERSLAKGKGDKKSEPGSPP